MGEEEQKYLWMSRWWRLKFEADMAVEPDGDRFDTSIDPASINAVSGQFLMIRESANTEMFVALLLCVIFVLFLCQIKCKTAQKNAINFHSVPNAFSALFLLYLNICAARSCFYVSLHLCQITCPPTIGGGAVIVDKFPQKQQQQEPKQRQSRGSAVQLLMKSNAQLKLGRNYSGLLKSHTM